MESRGSRVGRQGHKAKDLAADHRLQAKQLSKGWKAPTTRAALTTPSTPGAHSRMAVVRDALTDANRLLWAANPEGARAKFEKLLSAPFVFFRGTAGLFYLGIKDLDAHLPKVTLAGDVHPENYAVGEGSNGKLYFGLNDFDEAAKGPFSWDLRRGATAFELAARERQFSKKQRARINAAFVEGYRDALPEAAKSARKGQPLIGAGYAAGSVVKRLFAKAEKSKRKDFLEERVDLKQRRFLTNDEIKPQTGRLGAFKAALSRYVTQHRLGGQPLELEDAALKLDSGTASLGSQRYYLLAKHPKGSERDRVLEVKQSGASVLAPFTEADPRPAGERVLAAQHQLSPGGDSLYGALSLEGQSFIIRERQPVKSVVDLTKLNGKELEGYAKACGAALAAAHARSPGAQGVSAAKLIHQALGKKLVESILHTAVTEADKVVVDHGLFKGLWSSGEFEAQLTASPTP